jgi:drug/metabolite transporter (DMT)-like permease
VLAVSSAAVVFRKVDKAFNVAPITLAAWRLQLTTLVMVPPCAWQAYHASPSIRRDWLQAWWILAASGVCLAAHFGTWVWGLVHTSVAHALLFVTSVPLLLAAGAVVLRMPISRGEIVGAACGFGGMILLSVTAESEEQVRLCAPCV